MAVAALQASRNGNGCGVAIVPLSTPDGIRVLQVTVLPKFWSPGGDVVVNLDRPPKPSSTSPRVERAQVHEGQRLLLESSSGPLLQSCVDALIGLVFRDDSPIDPDVQESDATAATAPTPLGRVVPLFEELPNSDLRLRPVQVGAASNSGAQDLLDVVAPRWRRRSDPNPGGRGGQDELSRLCGRIIPYTRSGTSRRHAAALRPRRGGCSATPSAPLPVSVRRSGQRARAHRTPQPGRSICSKNHVDPLHLRRALTMTLPGNNYSERLRA